MNSFSLGLESGVQVGDVRLVVLAVMQFHDLGGDVGFQRLSSVSVCLRPRGRTNHANELYGHCKRMEGEEGYTMLRPFRRIGKVVVRILRMR